jgi:transglutaminase-like putative cysteine protease
MNFERFFIRVSYLAVLCGYFSLWVSGTFGQWESILIVAITAIAWFSEGRRWQINERIGTTLIVLALPASYLAYKYQVISFPTSETAIAGILSRMILALTAIKLLQKKSERDWIFLYLMSFFEVLLAAGLSISTSYLLSFLLYLLVMVCTIIAFEMRKSACEVEVRVNALNDEQSVNRTRFDLKLRRLPVTAIVLIVFIALLATPLFFVLPRVGGAGLGSFQHGLSTSTGFSDTVRLGSIGRIQENDAVVMRVKIESGPAAAGNLYFRGVALDTFDNRSWSRSKIDTREPYIRGDRDLIQVDYASGRENLLMQTVYLEPLDTPVLFAVPRVVALQGNFPILYKDKYGAVSVGSNNERVSYKVLSDRSMPPVESLRSDNQGYSPEMQNYLQLPNEFDPRISDLASSIAGKIKNRFDKAMAIQNYLRGNFGYTLEMKAGGSEPLSDFLFNVRQGHCEYFASAMAVMLRTQGVATRIVNGFHQGDYNETAGMYVVRQKNAHAWVEVYFPKENAWVTFDPTPASPGDGTASGGLLSQANKYLEALDAIWMQYFVAFDDQEQRSLSRTLRNGLLDLHATSTDYADRVKGVIAEWWSDMKGDKGVAARLGAAGNIITIAASILGAILIGIFLFRRIKKFGILKRLRGRMRSRKQNSIIEFYERLQRILAERGMIRDPFQTPLEFAMTTGLPAAINITEKYNCVRFGKKEMTPEESRTIDRWLDEIERQTKNGLPLKV